MPDLPRNSHRHNHRLLGVVLCGGRSSRMGRDKSDLPHPLGGTFLTHAIARLREVCDQVLVSTPPGGQRETPPGVGQVRDPVDHQGPMVGVSACLAHAEQHGYQGCFFTPVDMPNLTAAELRRLRDSWNESPERIVCAVDAASEQIDPLVAIYPICLAGSLQATSRSVDRSLLRLIQRLDPVLVSLASESMRNVNRPGDL